MKTEFLKGFGLADEDIQKILAENGKDIEREKAKTTAALEEVNTLKADKATLEEKISELNKSVGSADEYKSQLEALQKQIKDEEAARTAEREKAEREADIKARFNAVSVDKDGKALEWSHEAIRADYLRRFGEIISNADNAEYKGKSDSEILYSLRKDDAAAIKTVTPEVSLKGAEPIGGADARTSTLMSAMGLSKEKGE